MIGLTIVNYNGIHVAESREVAVVTGKQHRDLLESIRGYIKQFGERKFPQSGFLH